MHESYGEGVAIHTDTESCGAACKGGVEALTGARAGRVCSRERTSLRGADAVRRSGRPHPAPRDRERRRDPARSETPCTHGHTLHENREILCPPAADDAAGRVGKSKDGRRRCTDTESRTGPALASSPEAGAGCGKAARPDRWRGRWVTMISTPTLRSLNGIYATQ